MSVLFRSIWMLTALWASVSVAADSEVAPIIIRGHKMYNSKTGERFMMKGMTYEYAVSDEYYEEKSKDVIKKFLSDVEFNTLRLYNINPSSSYKKFMNDMKAMGVYVLVSGSPDNDKYYGKYRYSTITKKLGPDGQVSSNDGVKTTDQTETCYPALLLEYGKKIAKNFAQYDNTLGIVVANEIMQEGVTAAACVKQYVADLKNWMAVNGDRIRVLPLAYAAADSAYGSDIPDADEYHTLKIQGLLCGDKMKDGTMQQSIDIYLINEYRWCPKSTYAEAYERFYNMAQGIPIVIGFGEYGCKEDKATTRDWGMVEYLYDSPSESKDFSDIFSGGMAYSFGQAKLSEASLYPMLTGGSTDFLGKPSDKSTPDFENLKDQFKKYSVPKEKAKWTDSTKCKWSPEVTGKITDINERANDYGWFIDSCTDKSLIVNKGDVWTTSSREGVVCTDDGATCDVKVSSTVGTSQKDICGDNFEVKSGGNACKTSADCGENGQCLEQDGEMACQCLGCYTGASCTVKDLSVCNTLTSSSSAPPVIFAVVGGFLGFMLLVFIALGVVAMRKKSVNKEFDNEVRHRSHEEPMPAPTMTATDTSTMQRPDETNGLNQRNASRTNGNNGEQDF